MAGSQLPVANAAPVHAVAKRTFASTVPVLVSVNDARANCPAATVSVPLLGDTVTTGPGELTLTFTVALRNALPFAVTVIEPEPPEDAAVYESVKFPV